MIADLKLCTMCNLPKARTEFFANKVCADGLQFHCKLCHREVQKVYRDRHPERGKLSDAKWRAKDPIHALKLDADKVRRWRERNPHIVREIVAHRQRAKSATPAWGDKAKMRVVYRKARELGFEVDHIVPLKHPLVCGLHVWHNLQLLARTENRRKNNRFWPDMPQ